MDRKEAALEAMRISCAAAEGQLREAEALRAAEARARRAAERKVAASPSSCYSLISTRKATAGLSRSAVGSSGSQNFPQAAAMS